MKLSQKTKDILNYLSTINPTIKVLKGKIQRSSNNAQTTLVRAEIEDEFPMDFYIHDIKNFLKVASLLEEPEVEFQGTIDSGYIILKQNTAELKYKFCSPELYKNPPPNQDYTPANIKWSVDIKLSATEIQNLYNATKTMGLDVIRFTKTGIEATKSKESNFTNFKIEYENTPLFTGDVPDTFNFDFSADNLNLYAGSYNATLFKGGVVGAKFEKEEKDITLWVSALSSSKVV